MTDVLDNTPDNGAVEKRLADKDAHIANLENELAEFRTELKNRTSLEELLERFAQQAPPSEPAAPVNPQAPNDVDISEKVRRILQEEDAKIKRQKNIDDARAGLIERYGENYNDTLKKSAATLGVSEKFLADMAATSPQGLLKLLDSTGFKPDVTPVATPPQSSVDTSKPFNQQTKKNAAYYRELRRADINKYFSASVQREMHDEAVRQGSSFYEP